MLTQSVAWRNYLDPNDNGAMTPNANPIDWCIVAAVPLAMIY